MLFANCPWNGNFSYKPTNILHTRNSKPPVFNGWKSVGWLQVITWKNGVSSNIYSKTVCLGCWVSRKRRRKERLQWIWTNFLDFFRFLGFHGSSAESGLQFHPWHFKCILSMATGPRFLPQLSCCDSSTRAWEMKKSKRTRLPNMPLRPFLPILS